MSFPPTFEGNMIYGTTQTNRDDLAFVAVRKTIDTPDELWMVNCSSDSRNKIVLDHKSVSLLIAMLAVYEPGARLSFTIKSGDFGRLSLFCGESGNIYLSQTQAIIMLEPEFVEQFKYMLTVACEKMRPITVTDAMDTVY